MDFAIHIVLAEAVLGSHGTFIVSRAMLVRWHRANLVQVRVVIGLRGACLGSRRACLASHEAVLGSQRTLIVLIETCFLKVAKGTLTTLTLYGSRI